MPKVGNVFLVAGVRRGYMLGAGGGEGATGRKAGRPR